MREEMRYISDSGREWKTAEEAKRDDAYHAIAIALEDDDSLALNRGTTGLEIAEWIADHQPLFFKLFSTLAPKKLSRREFCDILIELMGLPKNLTRIELVITPTSVKANVELCGDVMGTTRTMPWELI